MALSLSPRTLARSSAQHPWRIIALWAVILVGSFMLIGNFMKDATTTEAKITSNADSVRGQKLLQDKLRGPFRANEAVVIQSSSRTVDDAAFRSYVQDLKTKITALGPEVVERSTSFYESNDPSLVSADRKSTIVPLVMAGSIDDAADGIEKVLSIVEAENEKGQFQVHVGGFASVGHDFNTQSEKDLQKTEYGPLPVALLILILVFGAVLAAFLPVFFAFFAIIVAIALVAVVGQQFQFSFFVTNMIAMMGLAVGIDYCLFIISRYREERARGLEPVEALSVTGGTAGKTVLFSGMTVVFALAGLLIVPQTIFRSLSAGAIFVVLVSVAASLTLLPAILSLMGNKVNALRLPFIQHAQEEHDEQAPGGFWDRVARTVMGHPVAGVVLASGLLIAASIPYFNIRIGFSGVSTLPAHFQSKQAFDIIARDFAGGQVYPAEVVINGSPKSPQVQAAIEKLKGIVSKDSTFGPSHFETNPAGDLGLLSIQVAADPNSREATNAIKRLRGDYIPQAFDGVNTEVLVTGQSAQNQDFYDVVDSYTPIVFVFVLGLSFLLLMLVFRSIVVPAKAIIMNLLSVGAAYGLIVLVFQEGIGNELLGFQQVEAIEAWLPLFLFSILFGLSMDYHVFLLSRIKERYDLTGDNTAAVAAGLRSTGRLITGAALIMVAVFAGFALGDLVMFQQMGFGLGVAVFIDATLIRSILVPASMKLLGNWNWYLPPLLSWLPRLGVEGNEPRVAAPEGAGGGS
ncbi:MAG TPA: MMPL family transporter [Dehalococcoidia bacterium]|nr:MMPL family transporter [Dehalococcoidia bacterium]